MDAPGQSAKTVGSAWNTQLEELLQDWRNRAYAAQSAHYALADHFRRLHYLVGIPAVILSSIAGTTVFTGLAKNGSLGWWWAFAVAVVSLAAAALSGLQTFFRFAERAAQHGTAGDWYSAIRRDIEQVLHLPAELRGKASDCVDEIRKEMNRAAQDAPDLTVQLWQRQARRFGVQEPPEKA